MQSIYDWLTSLPPGLMNLVLGVVAALENFVPPIPADVVVAFGSFLAARSTHSALPVVGAVVVGNVGGAFILFALGRRFGAGWIRRIFGIREEVGEARVRRLYERYGIPALFLTRFLPGVRALVPPLAGALRLPTLGSLLAISIASSIWYGAITYLAYHIGTSWEEISSAVGRFGRITGLVAAGIVALAVGGWLMRRRRRAA